MNMTRSSWRHISSLGILLASITSLSLLVSQAGRERSARSDSLSLDSMHHLRSRSELRQKGLERAVANYKPPCFLSLEDATAPITDVLYSLPGVVRVEHRVRSNQPTTRIMHIRDWHYISRALFAADVRDLSLQPVSDQEIDRQYEEFLWQVESVQVEQRAMLRCLIRDHGLRAVFCEGLAPSDMPIYEAEIKVLRELQPEIESLRLDQRALHARLVQMRANGNSGSQDFRDVERTGREIDATLNQNRLDLLRIGAAGQLYLEGTLERVLPLEESAAYAAANPLSTDGSFVIDQNANDVRQKAQVDRLTRSAGLKLVVLGGAHDLTDSIRAASRNVDYFVVTVQAYVDK